MGKGAGVPTFADVDELVLLRVRHVLRQLPHAGAPLLAAAAVLLLCGVGQRRRLRCGGRLLLNSC